MATSKTSGAAAAMPEHDIGNESGYVDVPDQTTGLSASSAVAASVGSEISHIITQTPSMLATAPLSLTTENLGRSTITDSKACTAYRKLERSDTLTAEAKQADLQKRLGDLPRELYDLVQHFAIMALIESGLIECYLTRTRDRERHAAEVKILQLSRSIRTDYAEAFYRRRTFCYGLDTIARNNWLRSMSKEHRALIGGITHEYSGLSSWIRNLLSDDEILKIEQHHAEINFGAELAEKMRVQLVIDHTGDD
jgi:hypothetical protein